MMNFIQAFVPFLVLILSFISPGCLLFLLEKLPFWEKLAFAPLISVMVNGLMFSIFRDVRILNTTVLLGYYVALFVISLSVFYVKKNTFGKLESFNFRRFFNDRGYLILLFIVIFFIFISVFYLEFIPSPREGDVLNNHLFLPKSVAKGTYFEHLNLGGKYTYKWGLTSMCFEMFYYPFIHLGSGLYKIIPTLFGIILLFEVILFMKKLNVKSEYIALGFWWLVLSPNFLNFSSIHFLELALACFTVGVIFSLYKHLTERKKIYLYLAGLLGGLGALIKPSLLALFLPLLFLELIFYKWKWKIKIDKTNPKDYVTSFIDKLNLKDYVISFLIFASASSYQILRLLEFISQSVGHASQNVSLLVELKAGILASVSPSKHGFLIIVIFVGIYSFTKLFSKLRDRRFAEISYLKLSFLGWVSLSFLILACLLPAAVSSIFRHSFPVYPILIIIGIKDIERFLKERRKLLKKLVLAVLVLGVLVQPIIHSALTRDHHDYITSRYGWELMLHPCQNENEKMAELFGEKYFTWNYINTQIENSQERVLSEMVSLFYLKPFTYRPSELPHKYQSKDIPFNSKELPNKYKSEGILEWCHEKNIRWVVTRDNGRYEIFRDIVKNPSVKLVYNPDKPAGSTVTTDELKIFGITLIKKGSYPEFKVYRIEENPSEKS